MADPRFFTNHGPFTLAELAEIGDAELAPGADSAREVRDIAALQEAQAAHLSFLDNTRYLPDLAESAAGACVLARDHAEHAPAGMALLFSAQPYRSYALMARAFYPPDVPVPGVHPTAIVDPAATLAADCRVEAGAVIGAGAELGGGVCIGANTVVGPGVVIGDGTVVGPNASLRSCRVGRRCQIHAGARIGERGFGFALDPAGYIDIPQVGIVAIGADVEIGANSAIDRGSAHDTVVATGSKIDNLVQIGHNVSVGEGAVITGQAGVAGSSRLGRQAMIGAQAGIAGHLRIGDGAQVAAAAGVMRDVPDGVAVCGAPAVPVKQFFRMQAALMRLARGGKKA